MNSTDIKARFDIMYERNHFVHCFLIKGTGVTFCWIRSHCGLTFNEWADRAAKRGAINNMQLTDCPCLQRKCATLLKVICGND